MLQVLTRNISVAPLDAVRVFDRMPLECRAPSHRPDYVVADAARMKDASPCFFVFERAGEIFYHGFHVRPVEGRLADIESPYGYGGPVSSTTEPMFLQGAWTAWSEWCAEHDMLAEFVRFHPLSRNWSSFGGTVLPNRETVWLDLKSSPLLETYSPRCRTAIRKAQKSGLSVTIDHGAEIAKTFPALYRETMASTGARDFYSFPVSYFESLARTSGLRYARCYAAGDLLAAAVFLTNGRMMEYHLSASTREGKERGATNLLIHEAAVYAQVFGMTQLHLGGGTDAEPGNPLLFFKAGFSGKRAEFRVGTWVHDQHAYGDLRERALKRDGHVSDRVLFYRG